MKKLVFSALVLMFVLSCVSAFAACEHDLYQADFAYPTCETDGYYVIKCTRCDYQEREINGKAYGHDFEISPVKQPTCTEEGYSEGVCSVCGLVEREVYPMLDHKWKDSHVIKEATCTKDGSMRTICSECGSYGTRTIKNGHKYGAWKVTEEATDHSKGTRSRVCKTCDKTESETFYPEGTLYKDIKNKTSEVKELQTLLTELGFLNDQIDGKFGKKTESAVKACQKEYGLKQDGIAWPQTINSLGTAWDAAFGEHEEPAEPGSAYPDACTYIELEVGNYYWDMCQTHSDIFMNANGKVTDDYTEEEYQLAYIEAWTEAIEKLYSEWFLKSEGSDQAMVLTHKTMFNGYLSSQRMVWEKLMSDNHAMALEKEANMLREHCLTLCAVVYALTDAEG